MNHEAYKRYLWSEHWREKRKEFLEAANYECEECGNKAKEVHHENYNNLGDETEDDVKVLCTDCHEEVEIEKGTDLGDDDYDYGEY